MCDLIKPYMAREITERRKEGKCEKEKKIGENREKNSAEKNITLT